MTGQLLRLLPARLLRALGYHHAHLDPAELATTLENAHTGAWAAQPADLRKALPPPRLGGPVDSWRPAAYAELGAQWAGPGPLNVLSPESQGGRRAAHYDDQVEWETAARASADAILFWIPRDLEHMPGFTTNVEFGLDIGTGRVVLGCPPGCAAPERNRYLIWVAHRHGAPVRDTLSDTVAAALARRPHRRLALTTHHTTPEAPAMTTTTLATARSRTLEPVQPGDLVAMIGCAASGKSSVLRTVPPHQIVSLDTLRAIVSEPGDQDATADAVLLQHHILLTRARRGATTYVDNTSVEAQHRLQMVELAHQHGRRAVAVLVDAPLEECLARNATRPAQQRVPEDTVRWQHRMARSARELLPREGWDEIRHLRTA